MSKKKKKNSQSQNKQKNSQNPKSNSDVNIEVKSVEKSVKNVSDDTKNTNIKNKNSGSNTSKNKNQDSKNSGKKETGVLAKLNIFASEKCQKVYFILIFIISVLSRFISINTVPGNINQDEAFAAYNAFTILKTGKDCFGYKLPMYLTAWGSGMNALETYLEIPFIAMFGAHNWAIRIAPAICGVLSLLCLYGIAKRLVNKEFALVLYFLASIMPWHVMLSRWALESNLAPAFIMFGLYFMVRGIENEKFYIASAAMYGLSIYAYAAMWPVLPIIIIGEVIYLICMKKVKFSKFTIISVLVFVVMVIPALLFILVNKGYMEEIKLPFLSIPKLVYFRGSEVSFENIQENFKNLMNIIIGQNDKLPWNSTEEFGLYYKISLPFMIVGIIALIVQLVKNFKKKEISFEFFVLLNLIAGLVLGALINVNVNRVNIIHFPIIIAIVYGIWQIVKLINKKVVIIPVIVYMVMFVRFEKFYYTDYRETMDGMFNGNVEAAVSYVRENTKDYSNVFITGNISYPITLFYLEEDVDTYLQTVQFNNYPAAFLGVNAFDKYNLTVDGSWDADGTSVYLLDYSYVNSNLYNSLMALGYQVEDFGRYAVYMPPQAQ
ncbi:MAG: glycosyltransferase family 39 protein [Lachnospiraceae bacterium]|nr:glycosyltransferase family 39 protein [Lachnospiraceae bacterium]